MSTTTSPPVPLCSVTRHSVHSLQQICPHLPQALRLRHSLPQLVPERLAGMATCNDWDTKCDGTASHSLY